MNDTNETVSMYGGDFFQKLYDAYSPFHLPVSGVVCAFGVLFNTLNIAVFTMRSMRSPINFLLAFLSVAQLCLVTNYLLLLAFNVSSASCVWLALHGYAFVFYKWINVNLSVVFHSIATCLTLAIAVVRFLAIQAPTYSRTRINSRWSKMTTLSVYFVVPVLCTPMFLMSHVAESESKRGACGLDVVYELEYTDNAALIEAGMWLFGVFFKLVPSSTISILSIFLIKSLKDYQRKKAALTSSQNGPKRSLATSDQFELSDANDSLLSSPQSRVRKQSRARPGDRKQLTKMLVAIALLCVSVELPHGVVNLLTAVFGQQFATEVYDNLGDVFEMLTLLYSSVNFVLYCFISMEYQKAFLILMISLVNKLHRVFHRISILRI